MMFRFYSVRSALLWVRIGICIRNSAPYDWGMKWVLGFSVSPALQNESFPAGHALPQRVLLCLIFCSLPGDSPNPMAVDVGSTMAWPPCLNSGHSKGHPSSRAPCRGYWGLSCNHNTIQPRPLPGPPPLTPSLVFPRARTVNVLRANIPLKESASPG